jgi:signal transduction histidine kinase
VIRGCDYSASLCDVILAAALRTPLTQIHMFSETLLRKKRWSDDERDRFIAIIHRETEHVRRMIDNVLLFSRAEGGGDQVGLQRAETELAPILHEAADAFAALAECRDATITVEAEPGLNAFVDRRAIRQVVNNLIDNALKHGPVGQTVRVGLTRQGQEVRIEVTDEGPGIPAGDRERAFEAFSRLTPAGGVAGGSGLGLAVVRDLVARHGGRVTVERAAVRGARFVVTLPRVGTSSIGTSGHRVLVS